MTTRTYISFPFPVQCKQDDQVAWQPFAGPVSYMHAGDVETLVPLGSHEVKALCANVKSEDAVQKLKRVLNEHGLPFLEELHIQRVLVDAEDSVSVNSVPTYTMRAARLPALHTFVAADVFVNFDTPLCRNLRLLHLEHTGEQSPRIPLPRFLDILGNCPQLRSLYEYCYIDARAPAGTRPPPVLSLTRHLKDLTHLELHEDPDTLSRILSRLVIPARVNVFAMAFVAHGPVLALRGMFPDDTGKWEVLRSATQLEARHTRDDCFLAAHMPGKHCGSLDLRLSPATRGALGKELEEGAPDGALIHAMIQSLDLFKDCPARKLCVGGNLREVSLESWATAFDRFPAIEELVIEEIRDQPTHTLNDVLCALTSRSRIRPEVVCPRLQTLRLEGAINNPGMLEGLRGCFTQRARSGAPPLRKLEVILFPDREWTASSVTSFRQSLFPLAATVDLKVHYPNQFRRT